MFKSRATTTYQTSVFALILLTSRNTCFGLYYFFPKLNSTTTKNPWEQGFLILYIILKVYLIISFSVAGANLIPNINSWEPEVYSPKPEVTMS